MRGDYFELARAEFSRAAAIEPTNVTHLLDIAHAYQREDDLVSAEVWLQEAVRVQPREEIAWIALARFYLDTSPGDSESGLMAARRAVALAPEDSAALDVLGWAQFLTGRIRLAETNLLAARERDPENSAVCYHLGRLLLEQERIDQAREIFQQILTMDRSCRDCRPVESGPYAALASRELVRLDY